MDITISNLSYIISNFIISNFISNFSISNFKLDIAISDLKSDYTRKGEKASVRRGIWDEDTNVEVYPTNTASIVQASHRYLLCRSILQWGYIILQPRSDELSAWLLTIQLGC